ncbi:MAG TPA: hypothetical protein VLQ79_00385, partial [Myxococcaceae bacterium]|nr:hypothetical protein [Myxococcaceae bacterium]
MADAPDKPGSTPPGAPGGPARATTTQPLAPVNPDELPEEGFETTGSFRTGAAGAPILDAPFPPAPRPAAPVPPGATGAPPLPRTPTTPHGLPA